MLPLLHTSVTQLRVSSPALPAKDNIFKNLTVTVPHTRRSPSQQHRVCHVCKQTMA